MPPRATQAPPQELSRLAEIVRSAAADELLPRYADVGRAIKSDGSVVTIADERMQERLGADLARAWPRFGLLGEEMDAEEQERLIAEPEPGLWVLDPLDGTSNFAAGIPYFSVSLALVVAGRVELAVVYDPSRDECFSASAGAGAWLDGRPIHPPEPPMPLRRTIAAVDFKRLPPALAVRLARTPPYSSQRSFGSVALDWCWLACGRFHVYLHGKQKLWDYAAGQLILREADGHACTLAGDPVFHADITPRSALAAGDADLFEEWRAWIAREPVDVLP